MKNWWERIAEDPTGSLERLAANRGMTLEQLEERHKWIAELFENPEESVKVLSDNAGLTVEEFKVEHSTLYKLLIPDDKEIT